MKVQELLTKYPRLLGDLAYLEVGEGWFKLIDRLCLLLEAHCKLTGKDIKAVQVKEKFGGLRFMTSESDDYVRGAIEMAQYMSFETCEVCGNPGDTSRTGWFQTLCEEHARKDEAKNVP